MAVSEHVRAPPIITSDVIVVEPADRLLASVLYGLVVSLAGTTVATATSEEEKSTLSTVPLIIVTLAV